MSKQILDLAGWLTITTLLLFTFRRWLFIFAALGRYPCSPITFAVKSDLFHVLLLVPLRNELQALPALVQALDRLIYPDEMLSVVLIDDSSTDGSQAMIQAWAHNRKNWYALRLARNVGKANALNAALDQFPQGDIVVIYDADERPLPNALERLILPFADRRIGGVSGRRAVSNALASPAASYTAIEGLVHQFVTLRAKDKLNLAPALLGANCAYRRTALAEAGNFKPGALLEDSDLTLKLARAGWKTHFEPKAISYHQVPQTLAGYWRQHTRWARGFNEVAKDQAASVLFDRYLPLTIRLELLFFSVGYLDRLAIFCGAVLAIFNQAVRGRLIRILFLSLLTPVVQIIIALTIARESLAMWLRVVWLPLFFGLDIAMAATGLWTTLVRAPQIWEERHARR